MKYTHSLLALGAGTLALSAGIAQADQVFNDDVIITQSLCVGQDCNNGESFGFDTIRLKENNLRIRFFDTSNSASFPTRDWQLTANDSSNGGANKFSIDDIDGGRTPFTLEAGAPSHSLYVDDGGRLGMGTDAPVVEMHNKNGDSPTLRLEQDGSSGFTPQTWDVAGNETNFFVRDATNGSRIPFKILPNAPTDALVIEGATGQIGFGTRSPDADMHVIGTGMMIEPSDANTAPEGVLHTKGAGTQLVYFDSTDNGAVQIRMRSDNENRRFLAVNSDNIPQSQILFNDNSIQLAGTAVPANLWATIDANGITTGGPTCASPCDLTFDPSEFTVPSIAERAEYMWENMHLPAVGPTAPDLPFNVTEKTAGMLHELEVAHIYIEQLDARVRELEALVEELR